MDGPHLRHRFEWCQLTAAAAAGPQADHPRLHALPQLLHARVAAGKKAGRGGGVAGVQCCRGRSARAVLLYGAAQRRRQLCCRDPSFAAGPCPHLYMAKPVIASTTPAVIFIVNSLPSPSSIADSTSRPTILTSPSTVVVTALVFLIMRLWIWGREGQAGG